MKNLLIVIVMLILCMTLAVLFSTLLTKRALKRVIRIMKANGALDPQSAKSATDLRLDPPTLIDGFFRMRDYKPRALQILTSMSIVQHTEEGNIFLSEEKLQASPLVQRWPDLLRDIQRD